ncbi:hypothetical protein M3Y98_00910800 [Aphelenchoides besseyi]|nr:hypothetical protein M3Y98_00910800 [Aphelenchoides besseyi]
MIQALVLGAVLYEIYRLSYGNAEAAAAVNKVAPGSAPAEAAQRSLRNAQPQEPPRQAATPAPQQPVVENAAPAPVPEG